MNFRKNAQKVSHEKNHEIWLSDYFKNKFHLVFASRASGSSGGL